MVSSDNTSYSRPLLLIIPLPFRETISTLAFTPVFLDILDEMTLYRVLLITITN